MSVFTLKILFIVLMFFDHLMAVFGASGWGIIPYEIYDPCRTMARLVFPLVCFLIVNGYQHTRNPLQYLSRMMQFAVLAQIPFCLAFYPANFLIHSTVTQCSLYSTALPIGLPLLALILLTTWRYYQGTERIRTMAWAGLAIVFAFVRLSFYGTVLLADMLSVFYTLGLGLCGILCFETLKNKKGLWHDRVLLTVTWIFGTIVLGGYSDYSYTGIALILLLYLCRNQRTLQCICILWFSFITYFSGFTSMRYFLAASVTILLILLYNGKPGRYKLKKFFYWFYPVHLLLLGLVSCAVRWLA